MASKGRDRDLRGLFRRGGALSAEEIAAALGVSQPTASRLLNSISGELVRFGRARRTRYALLRDVGNLGTSWPVFEVGRGGEPEKIATLSALFGGYHFELEKGAARQFLTRPDDGFFEGLPWFISDHRPQGFIGRGILRSLQGGGNFPDRLQLWSDDDVLRYFIGYGADSAGCFIIGDGALRAFRNMPDEWITDAERESSYPRRAEEAADAGNVGSSAAGEQPKFTDIIRGASGEYRNVIVKFSGDLAQAQARRWADLLVCEHIAGAVLAESEIESASTQIMLFDGRMFLEGARIDRAGKFGRRNVCSLESVCAQFFGSAGAPGYPAFARAALRAGMLSEEDAAAIEKAHAFGEAVGNTDMHGGNLSFYLDGERDLLLAPIYDMLPMCYAPRGDGSLPKHVLSGKAVPASAAAMAREFWGRVAAHGLISGDFKALAEENRRVLD